MEEELFFSLFEGDGKVPPSLGNQYWRILEYKTAGKMQHIHHTLTNSY
jgi:hypothetical protein